MAPLPHEAFSFKLFLETMLSPHKQFQGCEVRTLDRRLCVKGRFSAMNRMGKQMASAARGTRCCSGKPALTSGRDGVGPPGFRDPLSLPPLQSWSPSIARCIYLHSSPLIQTFSSTDSEHWAHGPGAQPCFRQPVLCSSKVSRLNS